MCVAFTCTCTCAYVCVQLSRLYINVFYPVAVDSHTDSEEYDDGNEGKRTAIKKRSELS